MIDFNALFESMDTIAVVGCSTRSHRASHRIAQYLQEEGFTILPVNPNYSSVLGETCYPTLNDIPSSYTIDVVDIFRNPLYTADMVQDAVAWSEETGQSPVVWTQIGVSSQEAEKLASEAGLTYVKNRCLMVEHNRWKSNATTQHSSDS